MLEMPDGFDVQGHRGARGLLPENTSAAFERALELGVTTLELDVVIAADETVVVSHDPWMSAAICSLPSGEPVPETEERGHRIFDMSYDRVAAYDCGRRGNSRFPTQRAIAAAKPRLADVIVAAEAHAARTGRPPVHYNIETKSRPDWEGTFHPDPETFTRALYEVLVDRGVVERAILQSFDTRTLEVGRRLDPAWRTSLLVSADDDPGLEVALERLGFRPDIYSPDFRLVDAALVAEAHRRGMALLPWTVNDRADMIALIELGVDGLITDYPDGALGP